MPLRDGSMRPSASLRLLFSPSERCSSGRGIMSTKTTIPFRLDPAFTLSVLRCGNPTRPSERPKNGWSRNPNPQVSLRITLLDEERLLQLSQPGVRMHLGVPRPRRSKRIAAAPECDDKIHRSCGQVVYY